MVNSKLKFDNHIAERVKKANWIVGIINKNFGFLNEQKYMILYKSLAIENIQKHATKLITKIKHKRKRSDCAFWVFQCWSTDV